jgi:hypothetical protein
MVFEISLKILHRNLGRKYLQDYEILNQRFRESIKADRGDFAVAKKLLRLGLQVNILAYCNGEPAGFIRLDLRSQQPLIGDLYVEPKFRREEVILNLKQTPWLDKEAGYKIWQYLIKAAFIIARRAGYEEVESYVHTESGKNARDWRRTQMPKWEPEVKKKHEPSKL